MVVGIRGPAPVCGAIEWVVEPVRGLGRLDLLFDGVCGLVGVFDGVLDLSESFG
jgi:hypothetical protein